MDGPYRKLSAREESVAELVGRGYSYKRIAAQLGLDVRYIGNVVERIAIEAIPNPDELAPQMLVALWAAHRRWLNDDRGRMPNAAA